jgi:hypothetical protein
MKNASWNLQPILAAAVLLACAPAALAQTFSSGSTGADGALNTAGGTITVRPGGVYHYTTVNISGTLNYLRGADNSPVVILAQGDVIIDGTISVDGTASVNPGGGVIIPGGSGGPGGFNGGNASFSQISPPINVLPAGGLGPGGGAPAAGGVSGAAAVGGSYGAPSSFVLLTPLFGGSGGGGGFTGGGGGGGGAILIASSTRIVFGQFGRIRANGASGLTNFSGQACPDQAAAGAGGAIRLVAPTISGPGTLQAIRGQLNTTCGQIQPTDGRIRVESFNLGGFTGNALPSALTGTPGAVWPAGNPALVNVPTLAFAEINNTAVPTTLTASYAAPDMTLPPGTANPVLVRLNATNTPVGAPTVITVRLIPRGAASSVIVPGTEHTGTFESSSALASVNLTAGQVTVLQAHAAMTLTGQTASLFPLIDGEPVERVMVAANLGEASTISLVTKSGREVSLEQLPLEDQMRVAQAWEAMKSTRTE